MKVMLAPRRKVLSVSVSKERRGGRKNAVLAKDVLKWEEA